MEEKQMTKGYKGQQRYLKETLFLDGVWEKRDDYEGIIFGDDKVKEESEWEETFWYLENKQKVLLLEI